MHYIALLIGVLFFQTVKIRILLTSSSITYTHKCIIYSSMYILYSSIGRPTVVLFSSPTLTFSYLPMPLPKVTLATADYRHKYVPW